MTMPGMNGSEVMAEMARLNLANPVVIASGFSDAEIRGSLDPGKVRGFLRKPYNFKQLIDCVENALRDPLS
jgi:FixJ family two-component response regulator